MVSYNFDELIDRSNTNCIKYDARENVFGNSNVIPLWVADMDFAVAPEIHSAIIKRAQHPVFGYTMRCNEFYEVAQSWFAKRYHWHVKTGDISFSPGVVSALAMSLMAFTKPGDKVIVQSPVYFPFYTTIENNGRRVLNNELKLVGDKYEMDFDALEKSIDKQTKMMFLCNPHNPVGRAWSSNELTRLAEIAEKHRILVVSDEIHADIVFDNLQHIPFASISDYAAQNTITCFAPSKTFNLAGLSTSLVVAENQRLLAEYNYMLDSYHIGLTNPFGLEALKAAYSDGEPWLEALLGYLQQNRDYIFDFFKTEIPLVKPLKPEATFLMWLDFSQLMNRLGARFNHWLINEAGLGLNNGAMFGAGGDSYQRLNFGCPRSTIEQALMKLKNAVTSIL